MAREAIAGACRSSGFAALGRRGYRPPPMGEPSRLRSGGPGGDVAAVLALAALWLIAGWLVGPSGEFPLNDDWAYAGTVRDLLERGTLEVRPWTPAVTLTHALWGALFCLPGGFSYAALRFAVWLLGLAGVLATYALLREVGAGVSLALVGALAVEVNPIYLELSQTFMTDVSFYACFVASAWGFARALRSGATGTLLVGLAAALAATLNRQIGLVVPAAYAAATFFRRRRARRLRVGAVLVLSTCALTLVAWQLWASTVHPSPFPNVKLAETAAYVTRGVRPIVIDAVRNARAILLYVGLFALPLSSAVAWQRVARLAPRRRGLAIVAVAAVAALGTVGLVAADHAMPLVGNILLPSGLGPTSLRDAEVLHLQPLPQMPLAARALLTALAVLGALLLVVPVLVPRREDTPTDASCARRVAFLGFGFALYCAPLLLTPFFDRYLLPLAPLAMGVVVLRSGTSAERDAHATRARLIAYALAAGLLLAAFVLSIAGVHDYLAWNRARWDALDWLVRARGVAPREIDGGFEFNARELYSPTYARRPDKSWWWVEDDRFVVSFGPLPGYGTLRGVPYRRWLPPAGSGEVRVLERSGG